MALLHLPALARRRIRRFRQFRDLEPPLVPPVSTDLYIVVDTLFISPQSIRLDREPSWRSTALERDLDSARSGRLAIAHRLIHIPAIAGNSP